MSLEQYSSQDPRIARVIENNYFLPDGFRKTLVTQTLTDLFALSYAEKVTEGPFGGRVAYERGTLSGTFAVKTEVSEDDAQIVHINLLTTPLKKRPSVFKMCTTP